MVGYKEKYADQIQEQFYKLEDRICADIIRRIKKTGEITSTADWQINKLTELGYSSAEIEDMIRETLKLTYPDVFEMYDKVIDWEYVRNRKIYEQINAEYIPFEDNAQLQQLLQAAKDQTQEQLLNLTQSLGIVQQIGGQFTLLPLTQFYQQTLDATVFDIASGAFDYNSVLKRTVNTLSRSGIRSIDYASGWSNRIAVAARRAVLTGLSQMTAKINEYNAEKLGTEFFEIDRHDGARPTHRPWQGKVWSKEQLVTVCGLGAVTGLNGANCYHVYFPFIPGVSERNYTDSELRRLDALEDQKKRFKDKEYNAYEARQKQRQMETAMRAQRAKVRGLERGGADPMDVTIAKARYQGQLAEYKRFSDAMGLKTQMNRVYIDGLGRVAPGKAFTDQLLGRKIKLVKPKIKRSDTLTAELLESLGVEHNPVTAKKGKASFDKIVAELAGGDETEGSCASVALAYIGQKHGYRVLDFRGGASLEFFSGKVEKLNMFAELGVKIITEDDYTIAADNGVSVLDQMKKGKEYYLSVGRHAAIVRRAESGFQYLELQSADKNGWIDFSSDPERTLVRRFGCTLSPEDYTAAHLVDIDQLKGNQDFIDILGYVNTKPSTQKKGRKGYVK